MIDLRAILTEIVTAAHASDGVELALATDNLVAMGIPREPASQVIDAAVNYIHNVILLDLATRVDLSQNDVEPQIDYFCNTLTFMIRQKPVIRFDAMAIAREQVRQGMENGDYYPESLRRLVGL